MAHSKDGVKSHYSSTNPPCAASLNLLLPFLFLEDHLWSLSTKRNMDRLTKQTTEIGKKHGFWLLHGLRPTSCAFKLGVNPLQQPQGRAEEYCFPWRRDWKITRLRIRVDWKLQEDCYCVMTKLPWYACELTRHLTVITYQTESQLQEEPQCVPFGLSEYPKQQHIQLKKCCGNRLTMLQLSWLQMKTK